MDLSDRSTTLFLVWSSGEGSYRSKVVKGLDAARREVCEQLWFGPYEEAMQDEMVKGIIDEFNDVENQWHMDGERWDYHGEQFVLGCMLVDEIAEDVCL